MAVGDYHLDEDLRSTDLETGKKSAAYQFNVYWRRRIYFGDREKPILKNDDAFDFAMS